MYVVDVEGGFDSLHIRRINSGDLLGASIMKLGVGTYEATAAMPVGWFHAGLTWVSNGDVSLYVNGNLTDTTATGITTFNAGNRTCKLTMGGIGTSADGWQGPGDSFLRYNRILSAAEVQSLYQESRRGYPDMFRWIDGAAFSLAADETGHPAGRRFGGIRHARPVEIGREGAMVF